MFKNKLSNARITICQSLEQHSYLVLLIGTIILGIGMRLSGGHVHSWDFDSAFLPWHEEIAAAGGLSALSTNIGNYSIPFQTAIALLTYLPFSPLLKYKALSCFFDVVLAVGAGALIWEVADQRAKRRNSILAFCLVFISPVVVIESGYWAQCDSIWASFCIWSLVFFIKRRYVSSFVLYGIGLAFKLQAIFLLPFMLFAYVRRRDFSLLHFFIIPAVMIAACLPAMLFGRNPLEIFGIYAGQTAAFPRLFITYPSIWAFVDPDGSGSYYSSVGKMAILFTVAVLLLEMYLLIRGNVELEGANCVLVALLFTYTCVLFLPGMHERYSYLVDALVLIAAVLDRRFILPAVGLLALSLNMYAGHVFQLSFPDLRPFTVVNLILFLIVCYLVFTLAEDDKNDSQDDETSAIEGKSAPLEG